MSDLNGNVIEIMTPATFKILIVALISVVVPRIWDSLRFVLVHMGQLECLLVLSCQNICFCSMGQESNVRILPVVISIATLHCGTCKINTRWVQGSFRPPRINLSKSIYLSF